MLYPIGIQSFEKIRQGGYVYVDKTDLIYKIAKTGQYYFLSRPRRFGKSLLVSTMEAYFKGKKELFDGLAVASLDKQPDFAVSSRILTLSEKWARSLFVPLQANTAYCAINSMSTIPPVSCFK